MILGDEYALHRHPSSGEPLPGDVKWTEWDYALVNALQLIEDFSDQNGLVVWEKDSDDVIVEAVKKIDKFDSVVERMTSRQSYKKTAGEKFVPRLKLMPGVTEWPTFNDWVEEQNKE